MMLTNLGIPMKTNLFSLSPLKEEDVEERTCHLEQLIFELEWRNLKHWALEVEAECLNIKQLAKRKIKRIRKAYEEREADVKFETALTTSQLESRGIMRVLEEKHWHLTDVIMSVYHRLGRIDHNEHKKAYRRVLYALTVQALCRLLEPEAIVIFRLVDFPLGSTILSLAEAKYKEITGLEVKLHISRDQYLPFVSCGGVNVCSLNEKVVAVNTLAVRLDNLLLSVSPMIRHYLFGDNQNRKFYDLSKLSGATGISIKSKGSNDSQEEEEEDD